MDIGAEADTMDAEIQLANDVIFECQRVVSVTAGRPFCGNGDDLYHT